MTTTTERQRQGVATIILVVFVLMLLAMMGFASFFQSSGTGRTYSRVVDTRQTFEAGDSAIAEVVTYARKSMDAGQTSASFPTDLRSMLLNAAENKLTSISQKWSAKPELSRKLFRDVIPPLLLSDVSMEVTNWSPPPAYTPGTDPKPAVGVMEFAVTVSGAQKIMQVKKTIRQRRYFYISCDVTAVTSSGKLDSSNAIFFLLPEPLGTVIE